MPRAQRIAGVLFVVALGLAPLSALAWWFALESTGPNQPGWGLLFTTLAAAQGLAALAAFLVFIVGMVRRPPGTSKAAYVVGAVLSFLVAGGAPLGWFLGVAAIAVKEGLGAGGAWGRPLRVRGRQLHPELREGADWTQGDRPDGSALDDATRLALEALWLHDAQKEHASVPAFARVSWMLAAVGAPAELTEWTHRAALEEIDHTRRCFALAAGYGGRSYTVEAMPDLLLGGLDGAGDPLAALTRESLTDGCQLEDFNADVAAECARVCEEPVTRQVLEDIAREERSHADLSWAMLAWLVNDHPAAALGALDAGLEELSTYPRPTAVSAVNQRLVAAADPEKLRKHGRLPDERWAALWDTRLAATRERARGLVDDRALAAE